MKRFGEKHDMKILMVNKFYYIQGGSETYYFALKSLLESEGHEVIDFSMQDERNFTSPYSKYFVSHVDYNGRVSAFQKMKAAKNIIYSREAKKKFERLIKEVKPDIIHLHIFQHQLSPSILDVIKKYNISTVYTAHELKMLCPNYKMMHQGIICEQCKGGHYYHCVQNRCVKDSRVKSAINMVEGYVHKAKKSYDVIDRIITPSKFYRKKFIEFGIDPSRVIHIPNFLDRDCPNVNVSEDSRQYYLYFGRLSEEKGIMTLLKALNNVKSPLKLVGTGPLNEKIKEYVSADSMDYVSIMGFKQGQELIDIIGNAKAVILPSEWYENGPYSAIEALQLGRPIIGANIGGIPELICDNGYIFQSGNVDDLMEALYKMNQISDEEWNKLSQKSKELFSKEYTKHIHYEKLSRVYNEAIENSNNK